MQRLSIAFFLICGCSSSAALTVDAGDGRTTAESDADAGDAAAADADADADGADGADADVAGLEASSCQSADAANIPDVVAYFPVDGSFDVGCPQGFCSSTVVDPRAEPRSSVCHQNVWCGASRCGDGVRDTCAICLGACAPASTFTEFCDGADLAGKTCASVGYGSGTLGCGADCNFDVSKCALCAATGPRLLACGATPLAPRGEVSALSIATSGDDTALVWTLAYENGVYLALYDRELRLVAHVGPIGHAQGAVPLPIAADRDGWVVAIPRLGESAIDVVTIAGCGVVTASFTLPDAFQATLAAEPGKPPLVAWIDARVGEPPVLRAGRLAADGRSVRTPVALFSDSFAYGGGLSASFVGDGFLVAGRSAGGVTIGRVEADGTFDGTLRMPFGNATEFPRLTSDGTRTEIAYLDFGGPATTLLASLDPTGAADGSPFPFEPTTSLEALVIDAGGRTVALTADLGITLTALPLRADHVADPPVPIAGDPEGVKSGALSRRGSELVAAWIGGGCEGRPHLARLSP